MQSVTGVHLEKLTTLSYPVHPAATVVECVSTATWNRAFPTVRFWSNFHHALEPSWHTGPEFLILPHYPNFENVQFSQNFPFFWRTDGDFSIAKFAGFVWGGVSKIGGPITKSGGGEGQSFQLRPHSTPPSGETLQDVLAKFPQCTRKKDPRKLRRGNG